MSGEEIMRSILTFRCASHDVMKKLLGELELDKVICLVQESSLERYKKEYPNVKVISIKQEYFNYNDFKKLKIKFGNFNKIYIPSSTQSFSGFEEIFDIIDSLKYRLLILYDCNGKKSITKNSGLLNILEKFSGLAAVTYCNIYTIYYEMIRKFHVL